MSDVCIVLPAYQAERTLERVIQSIPLSCHALLVLCDDASSDRTVDIAHACNIVILKHVSNKGYGANQKTLYDYFLKKTQASICVMLHPDGQYDAGCIPDMIRLIQLGQTHFVLGSRMLMPGVLKRGMPIYKYVFNQCLTWFQNKCLGQSLSEYHTGMRAYSRFFLQSIDFQNMSDDFIFDNQMIVTAVRQNFNIQEVPCKASYFQEASSISFVRSLYYGLGVVKQSLLFLVRGL